MFEVTFENGETRFLHNPAAAKLYIAIFDLPVTVADHSIEDVFQGDAGSVIEWIDANHPPLEENDATL